MKIIGINYNWYVNPQTGAEEYTSRFVGNRYGSLTVQKIESISETHGIYITYSDESFTRICNPNMIFFK